MTQNEKRYLLGQTCNKKMSPPLLSTQAYSNDSAFYSHNERQTINLIPLLKQSFLVQ